MSTFFVQIWANGEKNCLKNKESGERGIPGLELLLENWLVDLFLPVRKES